MGNNCPSFVTPLFLHTAENQRSCTNENNYCTVFCKDDEVFWYAHECPSNEICPPHGTIHWSEFYSSNPITPAPSIPIKKTNHISFSYSNTNNNNNNNNKKETKTNEHDNYSIIVPPHLSQVLIPTEMQFDSFEIQFMQETRSNYDQDTVKYLQEYGYDLRGLQCEILNDKEVCYAEHRGGRLVFFSFPKYY